MNTRRMRICRCISLERIYRLTGTAVLLHMGYGTTATAVVT